MDTYSPRTGFVMVLLAQSTGLHWRLGYWGRGIKISTEARMLPAGTSKAQAYKVTNTSPARTRLSFSEIVVPRALAYQIERI